MSLKDRIILSTKQLTLAEQTRSFSSMQIGSLDLTDDQAAEVSLIVNLWEEGIDYTAQKSLVRRPNGKIYRCAITHTSQSGWEPEVPGALWYEIEIAEDGILVWRQPAGAHDTPNKGDKRHYPDIEGGVYVSQIDGNTTVPGSDERYWKLFKE